MANYLLLESGDRILLEDSSGLILLQNQGGANTPSKRYSAMNVSCPWRGLNVVPDATIPAAERAAVMYLYGLETTPTPSRTRTGGGKKTKNQYPAIKERIWKERQTAPPVIDELSFNNEKNLAQLKSLSAMFTTDQGKQIIAKERSDETLRMRLARRRREEEEFLILRLL